MNRLNIVKEYADSIVANHCALPDRQELYAHLQGVAAACALLAAKRGLDPALASACGLMHDLYACWSGRYLAHGPSGAEMARVALRKMGCFSEEEQLLIRSAVCHHSDKKHVHDPYDEVLKDADTLFPYLQEGGPLMPPRAARVRRLAAELGIPFAVEAAGEPKVNPGKGFIRSRLADIAGGLAARPVEGSADDAVFRGILLYWPEEEAFGELKNGWCAAFVYHCCIAAGLELPIKFPGVSVRFAGVGAWLEWAKLGGFWFNGPDFAPGGGDIVIYDNVIPAGRKPAGSPWHDHIGVVLSTNAETLSIAEGNVDNGNISGVVRRGRHERIGGFVRIPDDHDCDWRKYDYKTGAIRSVPFEAE